MNRRLNITAKTILGAVARPLVAGLSVLLAVFLVLAADRSEAAGAACKHIINNGYVAAALSLEKAIDIASADGRLSATAANSYYQMLADIDIAAYHGKQVPHGGLVGVMEKMVKTGILTREVYGVFAAPGGYTP